MIKDILTANESVTPNQKEINILKENFPSCFRADGTFDMVRFSEFLKNKIDITHEGYELKFLGKNYAKMLASLDTETVIVPDEAHNSLPENVNSENVYISGDNLDGLKHLLKSYAGQVKCIYIDPPYNTGSDGFVYNDKFDFTVDDLVEKLGIDEEQAQRILDLTNRGSASHSAWLMFMYPRLQLARDLLSKDGVIFISIDDNECHNLKLLCDDIFNEANFEGHIHWRRRSNQPNDKTKLIGLVAEHILVYSKNSDYLKTIGVGKIALTGNFSNPDNDVRGPWASKPWKSGSDQSGTRYVITTPTGIQLDEEWMGDLETYNALLEDNRIIFPRSGDGMPRKKYFKFERELEGQCASNWWSHDIYGNNQEASSELENLFGYKNAFSNPKPTRLIDTVINLANVKENDIVLDFFSGSGTTAHSAMNYGMNTKCKWIVVQLPENLDELLNNANASEKIKWQNNIEMLDNNNRPHTLDYVGMERIMRAAKKIKEEKPDTTADLGFKHYTLAEVSQTTLDKIEKFDNSGFVTDTTVYDEFGTATVLTTWLVHDNYGFVNNCEMVDLAGYTAYWCENHLYLINPGLTEDAIKSLVEKYNTEGAFNPQNIVLFGYSFNYVEMENLKTNVKILRDSEKNLKINLDIRY